MNLDVRELDVVDGSFEYRGKRFEFIDYREFCISLCTLLNDADFSIVLHELAAFVKDKNISMKTKLGWNEVFREEI